MIGIEVDRELALLRGLRSDDDYTIGTGRSVNGGGGRILQDLYGSDVGRVQFAVRTFHAVDDEQRGVAAVDGTVAAKHHADALVDVTVGTDDVQTRNLALEGLHDVVGRTLYDVFALYRRNGTGEVALAHRTVTDDHQLVEGFLVTRKGDVDDSTPGNGNGGCRVTHKGESQGSVGRHIDAVPSVVTCHGVNRVAALQLHDCARKGLAGNRIGHGSTHLDILGKCGRTCQGRQDHKKKFLHECGNDWLIIIIIGDNFGWFRIIFLLTVLQI